MGERKTKQSLFERFMRFLNVLTIIALLLSYAGGMISPERCWPLAFAAMAYPLILAVMLFFIIYWLFKRKWFLFLNVALLLLKWDYVTGTVNISSPEETNLETTIDVMSFNVRLFDRYNWNEQENTRGELIDLIAGSEANIICIQEYYDAEGTQMDLLKSLRKQDSEYQIHTKNYFAQKDNKRDFGIAIITNKPIINTGTVVLENSRDALSIFVDLSIDGDTVRVYNVHLQSILLGADGYRVLNEIIDNERIERVDDGKLMVSRLKSGFKKRAVQAEKIAKHMHACPHPIILCGDFNDVPTSYAFQKISQGMKDSFSEAGKGLGLTYTPVPFFRIDNILASSNFDIINHKVHDEQILSDHYAISATLSLKD